MGFLTKILGALFGFFRTPAGQIVKQALLNMLKSSSQVALDILMQEAKVQHVILDNTKTDLSGPQKADVLRAHLEAVVKREALTASTSLINLAIETAHQANK